MLLIKTRSKDRYRVKTSASYSLHPSKDECTSMSTACRHVELLDCHAAKFNVLTKAEKSVVRVVLSADKAFCSVTPSYVLVTFHRGQVYYTVSSLELI